MNELKTKEARSNELLSFLEEEHSKVKNFKDSVFIKNATPISWLQDHDARLVAKVVEIVKKELLEGLDEAIFHCNAIGSSGESVMAYESAKVTTEIKLNNLTI